MDRNVRNLSLSRVTASISRQLTRPIGPETSSSGNRKRAASLPTISVTVAAVISSSVTSSDDNDPSPRATPALYEITDDENHSRACSFCRPSLRPTIRNRITLETSMSGDVATGGVKRCNDPPPPTSRGSTAHAQTTQQTKLVG